jgi:hypothetical protein
MWAGGGPLSAAHLAQIKKIDEPEGRTSKKAIL